MGEMVGKEKIFFLTPGFAALEYRIESESEEIEIEVRQYDFNQKQFLQNRH